MKTILLIQHTESEHHVNQHIGAQYEWNLTARGREQAFRIGKWLKREGCDQDLVHVCISADSGPADRRRD